MKGPLSTHVVAANAQASGRRRKTRPKKYAPVPPTTNDTRICTRKANRTGVM